METTPYIVACYS